MKRLKSLAVKVAVILVVVVGGRSIVGALELTDAEIQERSISDIVQAYESYAVAEGSYPQSFDLNMLRDQGYLSGDSLAFEYAYEFGSIVENTQQTALEPSLESVSSDTGSTEESSIINQLAEDSEPAEDGELSEEVIEEDSTERQLVEDAQDLDQRDSTAAEDEIAPVEAAADTPVENIEQEKAQFRFPVLVYMCLDRVAVLSVSDTITTNDPDSQWWNANGCPVDANMNYFQLSEGDLLLLNPETVE